MREMRCFYTASPDRRHAWRHEVAAEHSTSELPSDYRIYLERRRADIKDVLEAVIAFHPPEAYEDNHLVDTLECEFDYLSALLQLPDLDECLERWIAADNAAATEDDDEDG